MVDGKQARTTLYAVIEANSHPDAALQRWRNAVNGRSLRESEETKELGAMRSSESGPPAPANRLQ